MGNQKEWQDETCIQWNEQKSTCEKGSSFSDNAEISEYRRIEIILPALPMEARDLFSGIYNRFESICNEDSQTVQTALEDYVSAMVQFLEIAEESRSKGNDAAGYIRAVEELYLMYCVRSKSANAYFVPDFHPIRVMNKQLELISDELLERQCAENISLAEQDQETFNLSIACQRLPYDILYEIFETKKKNRQQIRFYCRNQVYETAAQESTSDTPQGWIRAYPFRQLKNNTEISCFRIWEKLSGYQKRHPNVTTINVAVFGELKEKDKWDRESNELLNSDIQVRWDLFENNAFLGEYYFQNITDGTQQLYDLSNIEDAKELVQKYNIILFLDLNCFYRQYQTEKTVEERNEGVNCRWYLDRSREQNSFKDKSVYYLNIYWHVGKWLNSLHETNSASFEFDANLFRNLMAVSKGETDIYLYIKDSNKIASYNLDYSGVCNDEYYGGKTLLVYKMTQDDPKEFDKNYKQFLEQSLSKSRNLYVRIKFWKLLKSINDQYCSGIIEIISEEKGMTRGSLIKELDRSFLVLGYNVMADERQISIKYDVSLAEELKDVDDDGKIQSYLKMLGRVVLDYASENQNMYCIKKYFKELLINSIITNARDIDDLVFAYIWSQPWINWSFQEATLTGEPYTQSVLTGRHKLQKTIYILIERLDNLRMRNIPNIRGYFFDVFRRMVSSEIGEDCFEQTLQLVAECCKKFNYVSSSLYLNSNLIDNQKEKNS